jgi:hypothetical protein
MLRLAIAFPQKQKPVQKEYAESVEHEDTLFTQEKRI